MFFILTIPSLPKGAEYSLHLAILGFEWGCVCARVRALNWNVPQFSVAGDVSYIKYI